MEKLDLRYEGKAKKVFATDQERYYWVEYKDDATAFNGVKKGRILDKGIVNNQMSALFFKKLEQEGISTHFVELINEREMIVKSLEMLPLEVVIRNVVAGSLAKRVGVEEGYKLSQPVVELYYKDDTLGDPLVNESHVAAMNWAEAKEVEQIKQLGLQINNVISRVAAAAGIDLIDFKLEFGKSGEEIMLGDEISPDTCRFWDQATQEKLDKDRFRRDLGKVEEAYFEVFERIKKVIDQA